MFYPYNPQIYPPVGMFSITHLIVFILTILIVLVTLFLSRKIKKEELNKIIKIFAIIFTILELVKILYKFYYKYYGLDNWVPLAYCSLFIYSLWFSVSKNKFFQNIGKSFLVSGNIAGLSFLIMPTTSFTFHPIYHFLCIHSIIFHASMLYIGILIIVTKNFEPKFNTYPYYIIFVTFFAVIAEILNITFGSNLMMLSNPYKIPIVLIQQISQAYPYFYTFIAYLCYILLYGVICLVFLLFNKQKGE